MKSARTVIVALALLSPSVISRPCAAGSGEVATAEALFQDARELMRQQQFSAACPKLAESQRLDPAVGTLLYLAECYEKNGQTASAWATFELAASEGRKDNQEQRERIARERAEALLPKLSRLTVEVPDDAKVEGLQIERDDTSVGSPTWGVALPVDPGAHTVRASAPGYKPWTTTIEVGEAGDRARVEVPQLEEAPVSDEPTGMSGSDGASADGVAEDPSDADPTVGRTQRIIGLATAGLGVVGAGLGAYFLIDAQSKESDSEQYCDPETGYTVCSDKGNALIEDAQAANTTGIVLMVAGGAAVVGGAVVYFTAPSAADGSFVRMVPAVTPRWAGLSLDGRF